MNRAAYDRMVRAAQREERAKHLRAASHTERAPMIPEQELFSLANPLALLSFWGEVRSHGDMLMWQRRASVLRAWCALRLARQTGNAAWRKIAREELAHAAKFGRDERFARGLGRRGR